MALETGTYVNDLVAANPPGTDGKNQGDDHLRLIKTVLKNSFAGFPGLIFATGTEAQGASINEYVVTVSPAPAAYTNFTTLIFKATHTNTGVVTIKINALATRPLLAVDGSALEAGDIENGALVVAFNDGTNFFLMSGNDRSARAGDTYTGTHDFSGATSVTLPANTAIGTISAAELAALDGITGNIQTQINNEIANRIANDALKANLAGGNVFSGLQVMLAQLLDGSTAVTQPSNDASTKIATTDFVMQVAFSPALPGQPGGPNPYWLRSQNGIVSWQPNQADLYLMDINTI